MKTPFRLFAYVLISALCANLAVVNYHLKKTTERVQTLEAVTVQMTKDMNMLGTVVFLMVDEPHK